METQPQLQLEKLSTLGRWIYESGVKLNVVNTTLTALNVSPEPDVAYLLGDRYLDFSLCVVFALLYPVIRGILTRFVFEPLGKRALSGGDPKKTDVQVDEQEQARKLRKWNESCWKMTVYIAFTALAFAVCWGEIWFTDSRYWWLGCSRFPPCNLPVSRGVLLFYCAETGFYLQAIHFLAVHEERRKDWLESMIHHVVTSGLLFYSYAVNFTRVGVVVILIHDVSDIFLEMAKLARYADRNDIGMPAFIVFFVSWVVARVLIFPAYVIRSTLFEPVMLVAAQLGIEPHPHWEIFNGLLLVLFVLHLYWTVLIFQVIQRQFTHGKMTDVREAGEE
ncbi:hypothetical protein VOLCADRAFT_106486 [Volvox carteri f. nagariensis]|uniref:TLC domain-containing protein n=1 Tax=Volvox carteri f. nagariensis TaxID=3068 RepID=D8U7Q1_VOLCA|nr:uncharacterized protein VOLCADRAFT_106486 [Volvox carteri f. nagariensis]EFJ44272.1 hypothetical protein VOLCADRAFT_106486 [Volvox carteri f. nagariensis]|eukprot:XP_002954631.1 hypothetical protein VOLCADRAFT_106486 [Volvox carteri f. nagariensis]